jgi:serine/threonine protein kinase
MDSSNQSAGPTGYCATCEASFEGHEVCPVDGSRLMFLDLVDGIPRGHLLDDRYVVEEKIGAGGMGAVYRATQVSVGREVAIKLLARQPIGDGHLIKRFLREAKLTSRLNHPNAVSVLDFGQSRDGNFYLVMELLRGRTLGQLLIAERRLSPDRVRRIGIQICGALAQAHRLAILHRDLKPSNVMLLDEPAGQDVVKVLDFGVGKSLSAETTTGPLTGTGAIVGTPAYMPPEMIHGRDVDHRGDLYSLGVLLYQLAIGRTPFHGSTLPALLHQLVNDQPVPPHAYGIPEPLAGVIARLIAKNPDDRPSDAATVAADLMRRPETAPTVTVPLDGAIMPFPDSTRHPLMLENPPSQATVGNTPSQLTVANTPSQPTPYPPTTPYPATTPFPEQAPPRRRTGVAIAGGLVAAAALIGGLILGTQILDGRTRTTRPAPVVTPVQASEPPPAPAVAAETIDAGAATVDAGSAADPAATGPRTRPASSKPPRDRRPPRRPPRDIDAVRDPFE